MLRLTIQSENPQVEEFLALLTQAYPEASYSELYSLLNNVLLWLKPVCSDFPYRINLDAGDVASLDFVRTEPVSSLHPDAPSESGEQSSTV
jgi:hypothetical protein